MNPRVTWFVLLVLAFLMAGCASTQLSAERRAGLKKVAIGVIDLPKKPTIFGENAGGAFLFGGPIGLAIANSGSDVPTEFKKVMERSKTDVDVILREQLGKQLGRKGFQVVDGKASPPDAVLVAKVLQYGLTGNIFASPPTRVPAFWLRLDLKDPRTGETIWWHWASVHVTKGIIEQLEARPIADYFTDDALLRGQFIKACTLVTEAALTPL